MSNVGWIKLHRKILNWEWYKDSNVCRVYIHFLLTAVYEDTKWKGKSLKKGDCIFSIAEMSKQLDLTRQQLRTVMEKLKSTNNITIKSTNNYHIINITKYSSFIEENAKEIKQNNFKQPVNKPTLQPQSNQPGGAFKEINNLNNNIYKNTNSNELVQKERGSRLDVNLKLSLQWREYAIKQGITEPEITFEQFKNYWTSPNAKMPIKKDWLATWRNWVLKEAKAKKGNYFSAPYRIEQSNPYEGMTTEEIIQARGIVL